MSKIRRIVISEEFSDEPFGRDYDDGDYNGEAFRENFLKSALNDFDKVIVDMNGALGYGSSFLEESFGGLVRKGYFTKEQLHRKLEVIHSRKSYVDEVWDYIGQAKPE